MISHTGVSIVYPLISHTGVSTVYPMISHTGVSIVYPMISHTGVSIVYPMISHTGVSIVYPMYLSLSKIIYTMSCRRCGRGLAMFGSHIIPESMAVVHFKSDHRVTQTGFKIRFETLGKFMCA